ncbi:MAG: ribonuclease J [Desulfobacterales bacterium]|nr:ribonuclease J [Desulfobacterales bacterium]
MLKIIPLGGLGEIGLNMMVIEYEDTLIIVDVGLMFPENYMLGIDIVIPDMSYVLQKKHSVAGIVLTHAHEDHIGALPYLLREAQLPVYATPFTLAILKHKLEEHGLLCDNLFHTVHPDMKIPIGPFEVDFIRVSHSIIDGVGLAIHTPLGVIIHTGDFRISYSPADGITTDIAKFARYGQQGVLALFSDSTNVEHEGYNISDQVVGETLAGIIGNSPGRVIVALFASNVARMQQLIDIASNNRRKIVLSGRSIELTAMIAQQLGYLTIHEDMQINEKAIDDYPEQEILMITTGSQGEPMSALARMASGFHKHIKVKKGDTIILSSKFIPGNEKAIAHIINNLYRRGADVIYDKVSEVHVSGHAYQEELKLMLQLTNPKYFIPIHGEYRHLVHHARLARLIGIPENKTILAENGQVIVFDEQGARIADSVHIGRILIDGKGIGDIGKSVLKERRSLAEDGLVVVVMAIDEETQTVMYGPEIFSKGFVFLEETGHLLLDAQCVILEIVEDVALHIPDRIHVMKTKIQKALRQYFNFVIKRKPVILPVIFSV